MRSSSSSSSSSPVAYDRHLRIVNIHENNARYKNQNRTKRITKKDLSSSIDYSFAIAKLQNFVQENGCVMNANCQFVKTSRMGLGGIVVREDVYENDILFSVPIQLRTVKLGGESARGEKTKLPVAMRWDVCFDDDDAERLGFPRAMRDVIHSERLIDKLAGIVEEEFEEKSFPLDSKKTSLLAISVLWQDLRSRTKMSTTPHWKPYCDLLPTDVNSLLCWSDVELSWLQNSRLRERAERRKKLVEREFDVLFDKSSSGLRTLFERAIDECDNLRFETLFESFVWAYATVLARAFTIPEVEEGGCLLLCPGLDIFNSARDAAKCEVRLISAASIDGSNDNDDDNNDINEVFESNNICLRATVGGYRAGTQAFHDYADHASGGALLEFGFIYDDELEGNYLNNNNNNEDDQEIVLYEGATEVDIDASAVLKRFVDLPIVQEEAKKRNVRIGNLTYVCSNVTQTPWDPARKRINDPVKECISKNLLDLLNIIEERCGKEDDKITARELISEIISQELSRYASTTIEQDLDMLTREIASSSSSTRLIQALRIRSSEKMLFTAIQTQITQTIKLYKNNTQ